jgi:hypothetical protein
MIPFNWQVIDNSVVELHNLANKMTKNGGKIVKLNTDSVVVENGTYVTCEPGIGNYRQEQVPGQFI